MKATVLVLLSILGVSLALEAQLGGDTVDNSVAEETYVEDAFGYLDLDDPDDDEDVEHRRMRHHHCWGKCVAAAQCHRRKADYEDDAVEKNATCPAKVVRCSSCMLDCKARFVKCGAEAMNLTVEQVRKGSERQAVAVICDKCDLRAVMQKCKPKRTEDDGEDDWDFEDDDDESAMFTLYDDDEDYYDDDDEDDFENEDADDKQVIMASIFNKENDDGEVDEDANNDDDDYTIVYGGDNDDDDNNDDEDMTLAYNVTADLEGRWRPRRCRLPVKRWSPKKRQAICQVSKCLVTEANKVAACRKNAVPVIQMYKKQFDALLKCGNSDQQQLPTDPFAQLAQSGRLLGDNADNGDDYLD